MNFTLPTLRKWTLKKLETRISELLWPCLYWLLNMIILYCHKAFKSQPNIIRAHIRPWDPSEIPLLHIIGTCLLEESGQDKSLACWKSIWHVPSLLAKGCYKDVFKLAAIFLSIKYMYSSSWNSRTVRKSSSSNFPFCHIRPSSLTHQSLLQNYCQLSVLKQKFQEVKSVCWGHSEAPTRQNRNHTMKESRVGVGYILGKACFLREGKVGKGRNSHTRYLHRDPLGILPHFTGNDSMRVDVTSLAPKKAS